MFPQFRIRVISDALFPRYQEFLIPSQHTFRFFDAHGLHFFLSHNVLFSILHSNVTVLCVCVMQG
jgi:hypothetical protein